MNTSTETLRNQLQLSLVNIQYADVAAKRHPDQKGLRSETRPTQVTNQHLTHSPVPTPTALTIKCLANHDTSVVVFSQNWRF